MSAYKRKKRMYKKNFIGIKIILLLLLWGTSAVFAGTTDTDVLLSQYRAHAGKLFGKSGFVSVFVPVSNQSIVFPVPGDNSRLDIGQILKIYKLMPAEREAVGSVRVTEFQGPDYTLFTAETDGIYLKAGEIFLIISAPPDPVVLHEWLNELSGTKILVGTPAKLPAGGTTEPPADTNRFVPKGSDQHEGMQYGTVQTEDLHPLETLAVTRHLEKYPNPDEMPPLILDSYAYKNHRGEPGGEDYQPKNKRFLKTRLSGSRKIRLDAGRRDGVRGRMLYRVKDKQQIYGIAEIRKLQSYNAEAKLYPMSAVSDPRSFTNIPVDTDVELKLFGKRKVFFISALFGGGIWAGKEFSKYKDRPGLKHEAYLSGGCDVSMVLRRGFGARVILGRFDCRESFPYTVYYDYNDYDYSYTYVKGNARKAFYRQYYEYTFPFMGTFTLFQRRPHGLEIGIGIVKYYFFSYTKAEHFRQNGSFGWYEYYYGPDALPDKYESSVREAVSFRVKFFQAKPIFMTVETLLLGTHLFFNGGIGAAF